MGAWARGWLVGWLGAWSVESAVFFESGVLVGWLVGWLVFGQCAHAHALAQHASSLVAIIQQNIIVVLYRRTQHS